MENSKRNLIIGAAAVIILVLIIAYGLYSRSRGPADGGIAGLGIGGGIGGPSTGLDAAGGTQALSETEKARLGPFPTITKEEIKPAEAKNIKVPETGEQTAPEVAAPITVQPAAPGVDSKHRTFSLNAEKDKFNPSTIIVKTGDTVRINFTAVDKTYDFVLGDQYGLATQPIAKGQTTLIEFQAWATGKFTFYCKLCGGLDSTAVGYVIVAP